MWSLKLLAKVKILVDFLLLSNYSETEFYPNQQKNTNKRSTKETHETNLFIFAVGNSGGRGGL